MVKKELYHYGVLGMKWGRRKKDYHSDYTRVHDRKSVKELSDKELRERNNRLQMEQQYANLTKKKSKGKQIVKAFIGTAGTLVALEGAYNTYKKIGTAAVDKIGDMIVNNIKI